jgi:hypothetical protein
MTQTALFGATRVAQPTRPLLLVEGGSLWRPTSCAPRCRVGRSARVWRGAEPRAAALSHRGTCSGVGPRAVHACCSGERRSATASSASSPVAWNARDANPRRQVGHATSADSTNAGPEWITHHYAGRWHHGPSLAARTSPAAVRPERASAASTRAPEAERPALARTRRHRLSAPRGPSPHLRDSARNRLARATYAVRTNFHQFDMTPVCP